MRAKLELELDETPGTETVVWLRCGVEDTVIREDGATEFPIDCVTLSGRGKDYVLYENRSDPTSEGMTSISATHFTGGKEQVLMVWQFYGTGNIRGWDVIDLRDRAIRRWSKPDLTRPCANALHEGELIGKGVGDGPANLGAELIVEQLVYAQGEPNCCPSGGTVVAHISGSNGILRLESVVRKPTPQ